MITKIEILPDDLHVHFSGENSEIFPIFGCEIMQKMSKIGIKGLVNERLLQHL